MPLPESSAGINKSKAHWASSLWFTIPLGVTLNLALALLALTAAVLCLVVFKEGPALKIRDADTGKVYGVWPLQSSSGEGDGEFAIEFVHSVHNSPVRETFRIEGRLIRPLAVRFASFGAGMQSDLEAGQALSRDGEALVISGGDRRFRELRYIVGTVSDHVLYINGQAISLRELCGRNAHITIQVK